MEAKALLCHASRWRRWSAWPSNFSPIDPIKALYWSAVINGVIAVPIMAVMMLIGGAPRRSWVVHGHRRFRGVGWVSTVVMAVAVIAMLATSF